jgi:predicted porin
MKKSLLALAVLGAFAGVASAQSSVTIFGIVDLAGRLSKDGVDSVKRMTTDGFNSSRIGLRGIEDLGGGFQAGFHLEGGLSADNGTAGGGNAAGTGFSSSNGAAFFNRRSTASLIGRFGEVRLGRDYIPTFWNLTVFDPFGTNGVGQMTNMFSGKGATPVLNSNIVRANNSVSYFLPGGLGGVYGQVMVAAGEGSPSAAVAATSTTTLVTPAVTGNKYAGGRVGFAVGPIDVAVAASQREVAPIVGTEDKMKTVNVGGSYAIGAVKPMVQYNQFKLGSLKATSYVIGATFTMGQGVLRGSYANVKNEITATAANDDAKQYAIGYVYNLSTRTALYGTYASLKNDPASALAAGDLAGRAGQTNSGLEFGLRHAF